MHQSHENQQRSLVENRVSGGYAKEQLRQAEELRRIDRIAAGIKYLCIGGATLFVAFLLVSHSLQGKRSSTMDLGQPVLTSTSNSTSNGEKDIKSRSQTQGAQIAEREATRSMLRFTESTQGHPAPGTVTKNGL